MPLDRGVQLLLHLLSVNSLVIFLLCACRLFNCSIGEDGCASLASALRSNPSHLKDLDLTHNQPHDTGVKMLSDVLADINCKLETLR